MSKIRTGRLRKLAKHLRGKNRAHKTFDFGSIASGNIDPYGNYCGSSGCVLGELPAVWPNEWLWHNSHFNVTKIFHKSQATWIYDSTWQVIECMEVSKFFSITPEQRDHLFHPNEQNIEDFGGKKLNSKATAEEVADNITAFIKKMA